MATEDEQVPPIDPERMLEVLYGTPDDDEVDAKIAAGDKPIPDGYHAAAWAAGHAARLRHKIDRYNAEIDHLIRQLEARRGELLGGMEVREKWWLDQVQRWHRAAYAADPKGTGKTVRFPIGSPSKLRAQQPVRRPLTEEGHEALYAWLDGRTITEGPHKGKTMAQVVYPRRNPSYEDLFRISALTGLGVKPVKADSDEPGTVVPYVTPDGETVPGLTAVVIEDRWST